MRQFVDAGVVWVSLGALARGAGVVWVAPGRPCVRLFAPSCNRAHPVWTEWLEMRHFGHAGVVWVSLGALARRAGVGWYGFHVLVACACIGPTAPSQAM